MNNNIILDTHVLLWVLLEPQEIGESLKKQINLAQKNNHLLISSINFVREFCLTNKDILLSLSRLSI